MFNVVMYLTCVVCRLGTGDGCLQGQEIPIYIWYDSYPTHSGEGYEGRVSRVSPDSPYGLASLNLTNIRESDQGWYVCKVVFLNRSPGVVNGTWFHLDVHGEYLLMIFYNPRACSACYFLMWNACPQCMERQPKGKNINS